ncbi:hypothetical protein DMA11_20980 [Marinilabiliaceae bacterium JC017]|nr:hypothetical protein DMA11_20980 [Marinilabiliaceae bacterium JC017]
MRRVRSVYWLLVCLVIAMADINAQDQEEDLIRQFIDHNYSDAESLISGLYVISLKPGSGEMIRPGGKVRVHYVGKFLDGTIFDSSLERNKPIEFILGSGKVIPGWEQGISRMRIGETALFVIPSYLAYGDKKVGPIPANTPLLFELTLLKAE